MPFCLYFRIDAIKSILLGCAACGRCNIICPACSCFAMRDIIADGGKGGEDDCIGQRQRGWSFCRIPSSICA
ncbi:MAG: 4Fe-4S dicluster domain-containing protein [Candidatus Omnitrophota bacterium]